MPEMDGFALLDALRKNPATAHIPVIMLSARAGEEARIDGFEPGRTTISPNRSQPASSLLE